MNLLEKLNREPKEETQVAIYIIAITLGLVLKWVFL